MEMGMPNFEAPVTEEPKKVEKPSFFKKMAKGIEAGLAGVAILTAASHAAENKAETPKNVDTDTTIEYVQEAIPQMKGHIKIVDPDKAFGDQQMEEGLNMQKNTMTEEEKDDLRMASVD